ncbi:MAG: biotin--[acetyl-CoA-carboxylase] ligase [Muribaculaceae bacterium]|nr:biotin--[acetyl-CoA-carboxylase] ligase [Muribaculaceae bacterium]
MKAKYILLHNTASTNSYLASVASMLPDMTMVYTYNQTSGRGQRGNSWESEPDKNLTFSILFKGLALHPARQFHLSEAVSIAIVNILEQYADGFSIKWPNDIYYKDSKICGILIENVIDSHRIIQAIAGIGINVNQEKFMSDAPNPISLIHIVETSIDTEKLLHELGDEIISTVSPLCGEMSDDALAQLHDQYLSKLYRYDNAFHPFTLPDGTPLEAKIVDVQPDGKLIVESTTGTTSAHYFKEIAFVI